MARHPLSRRQFIRGAGNFFLALPFLESLAPRSVLAAPLAPAKRFLALIACNGYHEPVYYPTATADLPVDGLKNAFYRKLVDIPGPISECLGTHYDPYRNKMNILRGLDIIGAYGHTAVAPLCAAKRRQEGDTAPMAPYGNSQSVDVVLSKSKNFYPAAPKFKALRANLTRGKSWSIDQDSSGQHFQVPYTQWPMDLFIQTFGSAGSDPAAALTLATKQKTIGDLILPGYKELMADRRISAADRRIASNFVDELQELHKKLDSNLTCKAPLVQKARSNYIDTLTDAEKEVQYKYFIDIILTAMACDLTRIGVLSFSNDNNLHGISHLDYRDRANNLAYVDVFNKYQNPIVKYAVEKMDSYIDAGTNNKSMLDNSLLFWGMEQSAGNAHCCVSMPAITFGSMNGFIKTGYYVDYRQRPLKYYAGRSDIFPALGSQNYNQLMNTIFQGLGLQPSEYEQYGDGGGFGSVVPSVMTYLNGAYDSVVPLRKNLLPFIS